MRITRAVVPSLFTILNAFCGFLSIISANEGKIHRAAYLIILAAVFDALDGIMARLTKTSSKFGVELDSLADVISFGVAPSVLVYQTSLHQYGVLGYIVSAFPLAFGAIRLARFNVQLVGFDKDYFNGLPIPHQAITVSAFFLRYYETTGFESWADNALFALIVVLGFLMVSRIKYDTLPKFNKQTWRTHKLKSSMFILAGVALAVSAGAWLFEILMVFVAFGVLRSAYYTITHTRFPSTIEADHAKEEVSSIDI
jgi:CDP-diacylglycerol--serine O-phosphatidyltransferase